jgi:hypothetical protein
VAAALVVVVLAVPGCSPDTASAQLPLQGITAPPAKHHPDPSRSSRTAARTNTREELRPLTLPRGYGYPTTREQLDDDLDGD